MGGVSNRGPTRRSTYAALMPFRKQILTFLLASFYSSDTFGLPSSTQFVLVFFACVLMTLRAAFYDVEIEQDDEEKETDQSQQAVPELDESLEMPYLEKKYSLEQVFQTVDDDSLSPR